MDSQTNSHIICSKFKLLSLFEGIKSNFLTIVSLESWVFSLNYNLDIIRKEILSSQEKEELICCSQVNY